MSHPITHDPATPRFLTEVEGQQAELVYRLQGGSLVIEHTGVPEAIGGRGIAGKLVRAAADYARGAGLKVAPVCSYSAEWMNRHPEYNDIRV